MSLLNKLCENYSALLNGLRHADGLAPLALRLYLSPIFIIAGYRKLASIEDTVNWFGNPDWGLGLPFPELLAWLASLTEFIGGWALLLGLATRLFSLPLMVTMAVATLAVHWPHGWQAVADPSWIGGATERVQGAAIRLEKAKELLQLHGNYEWLTESGNLVVLNNGIEFSVTYFCMCLVLFFSGGGRYVSVDYWVSRRFLRENSATARDNQIEN